MTDEFEVESFLYDTDLIDPFTLPDMAEAVERVSEYPVNMLLFQPTYKKYSRFLSQMRIEKNVNRFTMRV